MRRGDLTAAWGIADAALAARDPATRDDPRLPYHLRWVWDGRPVAGQTVVVRCYHGLGDTLQFVRFLPALRALAARVTLEAQPELVPLLQHAAGADQVVPFDVTAPIPPGQADLEIMELQHVLRLAPDSGRYLQAQPRPRDGACAGACWQAGGWDRSRSVPLPQMAPVLPPGTVALQPGAAGLPSLPPDATICDTAGLIAALDCVITVDTMVAHLAGALGRPVHLLLKWDADWRWGEGATTAWYPHTKLYRQHVPGDWSVPLAELGRALKAGGSPLPPGQSRLPVPPQTGWPG